MSLQDEFHDAVKRGDVSLVSEQLSIQRKLANARGNDGVTPLMMSSVAPNAMEMMQVLRKGGASFDARDKQRRTVLLYACRYGADPAVVAYLVQSMENSKLPSHYAWTNCDENYEGAVVLAVRSKRMPLVLYLHDIWNDEIHEFSNHVVKQLFAAIQTRDEDFVVDFLKISRVQKAIELDEGFGHQKGCETKWTTIMMRCEREIIYKRRRDAHLVQRRCLPGLGHLAHLIGKYLFDFDPETLIQVYADTRSMEEVFEDY
ncbi:unnamed protein product [Aphanomyces euteiches]